MILQMSGFVCQVKDYRFYFKNEKLQKDFKKERCDQRFDMKERKIILVVVQRIDRSRGKLELEISEKNIIIVNNILMRRINLFDQVMRVCFEKGRIYELLRKLV